MSSTPDPVSRRVVETVAESKGVDPTLLPPLTGVLNADALDELVASSTNGTSRNEDGLSIEFTYADCLVVIRGSDSIEVHTP